ncbi:hypothetical protein SeMB42_g07520 [Synchytrium endobioticum]|uniref:Nucleolar 27S pre-rRNA processing Urb2/Npa2 C-terminal domain-containing protein n=1 Tax=Synchytrium endobioticum TaxID=286115 RepID=A0A507C258_9FUNG|nr:hypothetical protein SeMB42_g07520 [Synchytrium endobioticum]
MASVSAHLRNSSVPISDKIQRARQAWTDTSVFVPLKHHLLFDWICNLMVKSTCSTIPAHVMLDICDFFRTLLLHLRHTTTTTLSLMHDRTNSTLWMYARIPILPVLARMMFYCVAPPNPLDLQTQSRLSSIISDSFDLVLELDRLFVPSFDQLCAFCLDLLERGCCSLSATSGRDVELEAWMNKALMWFIKASQIQPAQKRVFQTVLNKLLPHLETLYSAPLFKDHPLQATLAQAIRVGLFHHEHLLEYIPFIASLATATDNQSCNGANSAGSSGTYVKQFIQYTKGIESEHGFRLVPIYFNSYCDLISSHVSNKKTPQQQHAEFAFFIFLNGIIESFIQRHLPNGDVEKIAQCIDVGVDLLHAVSKRNIYSVTNDQVGKTQLEYVKGIATGLVELASVFPAANHASIIRGFTALWKLDKSILEPFLPSVWPLVWLSSEPTLQASIDLMVNMISIYRQSRQLNLFLDLCFSSLRDHNPCENDEHLTVGHEQVVGTLAEAFSATLPAQALSLVSKFVDELESHYLPTTESPKKKRKKIDPAAATVTVPSQFNMLPHIISMLIVAIKHVNLVELPSKTADETSINIGNNVLCPLLISIRDCEKNQMLLEAVLAILQLHECLLEWSAQYWSYFVNENPVDRVITLLPDQVDAGDVKIVKNRIICYNFHRLSVTLSADDMAAKADLKMATAQVWRDWEDTDNDNTGLLISFIDHIVPLSANLSEEELAALVDKLVKGTLNQSSIAAITVEFLQSPLFYELRSVRDLFISKLVSTLPKLLKKALGKVSVKQVKSLFKSLNALASDFASEKTPDAATIGALATLLSPAAEKVAVIDEHSLCQTMTIIAILNTIPSPCFTPSRADRLYVILLALEAILMNSNSLDVKYGVLFRRLLKRLTTYRQDRLMMLCSSDILLCFINSTSNYKSLSDDMAYQDVLTSTAHIVLLTIKKCMNRIFPSKAPQKPLEFITTVIVAAREAIQKSMHLEWVHTVFRGIAQSQTSKDSLGFDIITSEPYLSCILALEGRVGQVMASLGQEEFDWKLLTVLLDVVQQIASITLSEKHGDLMNLTNQLSQIFTVPAMTTESKRCQARTLKLLASVTSPNTHTISNLSNDLLDHCLKLMSSSTDDDVNTICAQTVEERAKMASKDVFNRMLDAALNFLDVKQKVTNLVKSIEILGILVMCDNREVGRHLIRQQATAIISRLNVLVLQSPADAVEVVTLVLGLLTRLLSDKFLDLKALDVATAVSVLFYLASPTCTLALPSSDHAAIVFESMMSVLSAMIKFRRELVINVIPSLMIILKQCLYCFGNILDRSSNDNNGSGSNNKNHPFPLLAPFTPLSPSCVEMYTRVIHSLSEKPAVSDNSKNVKSLASRYVKPISKQVLPLLVEYCYVVQSSPAYVMIGNTRKMMDEAMFYLLDVSGEFGRGHVLAAIPDIGGKEVFKSLVGAWEQKHVFRGNA